MNQQIFILLFLMEKIENQKLKTYSRASVEDVC
jgi:hypothetical protein